MPPPPPAEWGPVAGGGARPPTMHSLLVKMAAEEGRAGLCAGMGTRVAKVAPSCAIMISSYEMGKRFFASGRGGGGGDEVEALLGAPGESA